MDDDDDGKTIDGDIQLIFPLFPLLLLSVPDGGTEGRTDTAALRDARTRLKMKTGIPVTEVSQFQKKFKAFIKSLSINIAI